MHTKWLKVLVKDLISLNGHWVEKIQLPYLGPAYERLSPYLSFPLFSLPWSNSKTALFWVLTLWAPTYTCVNWGKPWLSESHHNLSYAHYPIPSSSRQETYGDLNPDPHHESQAYYTLGHTYHAEGMQFYFMKFRGVLEVFWSWIQ